MKKLLIALAALFMLTSCGQKAPNTATDRLACITAGFSAGSDLIYAQNNLNDLYESALQITATYLDATDVGTQDLALTQIKTNFDARNNQIAKVADLQSKYNVYYSRCGAAS